MLGKHREYKDENSKTNQKGFYCFFCNNKHNWQHTQKTAREGTEKQKVCYQDAKTVRKRRAGDNLRDGK